MVGMDTKERQAGWRERKKLTCTRIGDVWVRNELVPMLDDLCGYYGLSRMAMMERLIEDRHAAWSEGDDAPAPAVMTFKDKRLGHHRTKPCPTCCGAAHVQAFADNDGRCPTCGNTRVVPADD